MYLMFIFFHLIVRSTFPVEYLKNYIKINLYFRPFLCLIFNRIFYKYSFLFVQDERALKCETLHRENK